MQQTAENAWLLHSRKYTDTRVIVELLCENHGLVSGVYRVPAKTQPPQMFRLLHVCWKGKHALKNVVSIESDIVAHSGHFDFLGIPSPEIKLQGLALYCGFYLNELLVRLLAKEDPHTRIFLAYAKTLNALSELTVFEPVLRRFEFQLLEEMGYGLDLMTDSNGEAILDSASMLYRFEAEEGFVKADGATEAVKGLISGAVLNRMAEEDYSDRLVRRAAKLLSRQIIDRLLGGRALKSRELFRSE